jgi:DNA-binding NarL/FixJ family response regulator
MDKQTASGPADAASGSSRVSSGTIRVLVVDDHPAIREALGNMLQSKTDLALVGEAASAGEAMKVIEKAKPDVAVVDIALEDVHGLDLVQNIRTQYPDVQIVVFSMYDELAYAERAIRAGAFGYVMKSESTARVLEAIRSVARGEIYLSRRMASRILSKVVKGREHKLGFAMDELTDREMAVFQMLGQGYSMHDITERLHLSRKTVETYRRRAKEKLGFETVAELLQYAVQWTYGHVRSE